ncbi:DNA-binding response regulator [Marinicauda pacifica]|uniref:Response regulator n=1 Tax=Marinicauda pacifica TaxID=1133559 RepID=A0A4S2H8U1_9PROT|nr:MULTISPECIES: response regulator [Marinicauda]TGY92257.1 response regulator [Marinicauda pacifica]GGE47369.1 DNA-binding response regulator [Marinicauda pacifica]
MTDEEITIAITDDDDAVREGLAAVLDRPGRRIEQYPHGYAFLEATAEKKPDIAFLDLKLPQISGLDVLRRLQPVPFPVIMISAHGDISTAVEAIRLGAFDFVEKPFTPAALEAALTRALSESGKETSSVSLDRLTDRERDVAQALNRGLSNKEAARELDISPRTVEIHRARVFAKLDVRNIAELVRLLSGISSRV